MLIYTLFLVLLVIVALLLAGIILIQNGDGGISSSIGGAQMSNTFGASTPAVMVKITTTLAIVFAVITLGLNIYSLNMTENVQKSMLVDHAEKGITDLNLNLGVENSTEAPVTAEETKTIDAGATAPADTKAE